MADPFHARRVDCGKLAELAVLTAVLAIAALASYIHLRAVWVHAGAPVPYLGPLLIDGLFAAAWLRMRRRRRQGEAVGRLAWLALGLALVATIAGNLSAAVIDGHREPLALVVAAWPAIAFALVWELVTGHGGQPASVAPAAVEMPGEWLAADADEPGDELGQLIDLDVEPWEDKRDRLLREGVGRPRLVKELGIRDYEARKLLADWRRQEATG